MAPVSASGDLGSSPGPVASLRVSLLAPLGVVRGMDISGLATQQLDRQSRRLVETDVAHAPGQIAAAIDAVLALDVIEHLDDDRVAVARLVSLMRPGSAQMVRVPTLPTLSTDFDAIWVIADATYRKLCARLLPIPACCWNRSSGGNDGSCRLCCDTAPAGAGAPARHRRRSTAKASNCPPCPGSPDWRS